MKEKAKMLLEEETIQQEFQTLLNEYKQTAHRQKTEIITKAFNFANAAHKGMRRRSGEPYIMHPLAVARIVVGEIGLGSTSICSALLHDVVEDTDYTVEDIENLFGPKIASIVDGLTKISGGVFGEHASEQAENFRKLLLTMSEDIRVILIKIADRLHNMRTLGSMPTAKQLKIIGETLYIYAPLAHRLGLFPIKTELENLSFKYEHPDTYAMIEDKIAVDKVARMEFYDQFSAPINQKLVSLGYQFTLTARIKSVYSIWKKMSTRNIPFEEIYDLLALRIIFKPKPDISEKEQCWLIYSVITEIYKPHPERIRDWISTPKTNGYEALHVTVMSQDGQWVEVQIRSERMHEIAEKGLAAHWKYKTGEQDESELDKWLKAIKEMLKHPEPNAIDFMDTFKLNLFASEIFVFTPKGDIKTLPQGATALDFAFMLHSDLGVRCIGAKVNHKLVPLNYILKGGDQVEVLTSKKQTPKKEWLDFVTTARAQSRIKTYFKRQERLHIRQGEKALKTEMGKLELPLDTENLNKLLNYYKILSKNELMRQIGYGNLNLDELPKALIKPKQGNIIWRYLKRPFSTTNNAAPAPALPPAKKENNIILTEENADKQYQLAPCCRPIPGDNIMGYLDDSGVVIIHKRQCPIATKLKTNFGSRIVTAEWQTHKVLSFVETLEIRGIDKRGVIIEILKIISGKYSMNIKALKVGSEAGIFSGTFEIYVHDTEEIKELCADIRKIKEVNFVQRVEKQ